MTIEIDQLIIDEEYPGKGDLIKIFLLQEIRKTQPNFSPNNISFERIGKKSKAHSLAYLVYSNKIVPNRVIGAQNLLKILFK